MRHLYGAAASLLWAGGCGAVAPPAEIVLGGEVVTPERSWKLGEIIPVECLNRTIDTGEHIMDSKGELQYIPFPVCNETGRPLELLFGSETDINCTLAEMSDELFHLFEFYIHNDAPLSCRLPSLPSSALASTTDPAYTNLQIAMSGTLQLSHLHINPQLNVIIHTTSSIGSDSVKKKKSTLQQKKVGKSLAEAAVSEGRLLAAAAYSLPPMTASAPRIVIGDSLPLVLSVRWFSERTLPPSTARLAGASYAPQGLGGHVHISTVVYCLLSFGGGVAVSLAYWRGVELPRRLKRYGAEKLGMGFEGGRGGYAFPGKRD